MDEHLIPKIDLRGTLSVINRMVRWFIGPVVRSSVEEQTAPHFEAIKQLFAAQFGQMNAQFAQIDARFAQIDARFAQIDARFGQMDARFEQMDARFDRLERMIEGVRIESRTGLQDVGRRIDALSTRLDSRTDELGRRIDSVYTALGQRGAA